MFNLLLLANVLYSDKIKKINQNNWTQERIFAITANKIFNIKKKSV